MMHLAFSQDAQMDGARRVRTARFERRPALPVSAACLVANSVREALGGLYSTPLHVRLFEPLIPTPQAWEAIARDAMLFRISGARNDTVVIVRRADAVALATHAFGEAEREARALSPIERRVFERAVSAIASGCAAVGGGGACEPASSATGLVTFFELQVDRPFYARIGIGLSRDPLPEARSEMRLDDLLDVRIDLTVMAGCEPLEAGDVALLEPGALVPMTRERGFAGTIFAAGRPLASGECGVRNGRYAFAVEAVHNDERGL